MKRKILFITLFALSLTFIGCGKKETPVMSNNVETDTTIEDEVITEEVEEPTENIVEENITEEIVEEIETTTEISEGVPFEEGEYSEPSADILEQEKQEYSEVADVMEQAKKDMLEFYEAGIITKEDYEAAMETLNEGPQIGGIGSEYIPSASDEAIAKQYEENAAKAHEEMSKNDLAPNDTRTDIQYGQGDYSDLADYETN